MIFALLLPVRLTATLAEAPVIVFAVDTMSFALISISPSALAPTEIAVFFLSSSNTTPDGNEP